jgi:hypothetical protein
MAQQTQGGGKGTPKQIAPAFNAAAKGTTRPPRAPTPALKLNPPAPTKVIQNQQMMDAAAQKRMEAFRAAQRTQPAKTPSPTVAFQKAVLPGKTAASFNKAARSTLAPKAQAASTVSKEKQASLNAKRAFAKSATQKAAHSGQVLRPKQTFNRVAKITK